MLAIVGRDSCSPPFSHAGPFLKRDEPFLDFLHRPMGQLAAAIQPGKFLGAGGGPVHAAPRGSFPERNETIEVRPSPGTEVAPVAPPERSESVVVRPTPSPQ